MSFYSVCDNTRIHLTTVVEKISVYIVKKNQRLKQFTSYDMCCVELCPEIISYIPTVW